MILDEIAERTKLRVMEQMKENPLSKVKNEAYARIKVEKDDIIEAGIDIKRKTESINLSQTNYFPFENALRTGKLEFICEVKKASPSKGVIAEDFPYLQIARDYEDAGAAAISVLTEPYYFQGRDEYLKEICQAVKIPVLRKDFTVDEYQIYEAKVLGASAVLLICSLLEHDQLLEYIDIAHSLGLSALVETHDEKEVNMALSCNARIIGINNRNLKDFTVDINTSANLRKLIPKSVLVVSESGISNREQVKALEENNTNAVLIGELLMRSKNKKQMMETLRGNETK